MSRLTDLATIEKNIEAISARARDAFFSDSSFEKSMVVARSINELRAALTEEVMADIMPLMNTSLGFRTDQDPNLPSASNPAPKPYSVAIVRECFIEATLRGFFPINNEFNIIAGRFYGALSGFERLVRQHKRVTDFKESIGVPRKVQEDGALVLVKATWKQDKVAQTFEREFPVRINRGMGADAIIGKVKRKLYAAVLARLTGVVTPDGDPSDAVSELKSAAAAATPAGDAPKAEDLFGAKGAKK